MCAFDDAGVPPNPITPSTHAWTGWIVLQWHNRGRLYHYMQSIQNSKEVLKVVLIGIVLVAGRDPPVVCALIT